LRPAVATIAVTPVPDAEPVAEPYRPPASTPVGEPVADAGYSGAPNTLPAAMLDGDLATGWSNRYNKSATALLPAISRAHAAEWVSVAPAPGQTVGSLRAFFTLDAADAPPADLAVSYWNGKAYVPVTNLRVERATASNQPTTLTFDPVRSTRIRLDLTSSAPGTSTGFLRIAELQLGA
jgi:beta-galactosidase